ncbi:hypothetical protein [Luteolibacter pohnpeiensis]|uniref:hypothetical protein n=1 Tax=Luteolibacter pohnpeiensis TaxID=454153 RepID=UPI0019081F49|nr:hypothetical protein [Luteolibacter pohnpeiensis]
MSHWILGLPLKWLGISCRDFALLASLEMDRKLTRAEKFRMRFHGAICQFCRELPEQFNQLRQLARNADLLGELAADLKMSEEAKERILREMRREPF